jgi:hypothetical protein
VTAFHIHVGRCRRCGRRHQGRAARQSSTATGAAASQVGPRTLAWAAWLHTGLGVPFAKVATILRTGFGLTITAGGLVQALHRVGRRTAPTYHALVAAVRRSPVVAPDETGWKVGGRLWWLWVFVTRDVSVYAIQPGRGYAQAAAILGPGYRGIVVRDGWAPYRKLPQATHQTCLAHLLRRCHGLLEIAQRGAARVPHAVRRVLLAALAIRARRDMGQLVGHGLAVAIGRLEARTDRLLAGHAPAEPPPPPPSADRAAGALYLPPAPGRRSDQLASRAGDSARRRDPQSLRRQPDAARRGHAADGRQRPPHVLAAAARSPCAARCAPAQPTSGRRRFPATRPRAALILRRRQALTEYRCDSERTVAQSHMRRGAGHAEG